MDDSTQLRRGRPSEEGEHRNARSPVKKARRKKPPPPDQTSAEAYYYVKQMQAKTPMTLVLNDGEELNGVIEWYDRACLKLNRTEGPNLLVYKDRIKYMHKAADDEFDDDAD